MLYCWFGFDGVGFVYEDYVLYDVYWCCGEFGIWVCQYLFYFFLGQFQFGDVQEDFGCVFVVFGDVGVGFFLCGYESLGQFGIFVGEGFQCKDYVNGDVVQYVGGI